MPIKSEIEKAIEVKSLENKFIYIQRFTFGAVGAGGLGAPMVGCFSAKQFISLVPPTEPIYVSLDPLASDNDLLVASVKKTYWAFIENRAGLFVYEDVYSREGYGVKKHDAENVVFYKDNVEQAVPLTILLGIVEAVVLFLFALIFFHRWLKL